MKHAASRMKMPGVRESAIALRIFITIQIMSVTFRYSMCYVLGKEGGGLPRNETNYV